MERRPIIKNVVVFIIITGFIYFSQFYRLDALAYRIYDESHLATSAYEMSKIGNYISPTFEYKTDLWYTKPPMMLWFQVGTIRAFGLNEIATRLPSALAASFVIWLVFFFTKSVTHNTWAGVSAATILATAEGYVAHHGTRFGEYDGPLLLFTTVYLFCFFRFIHANGKGKNQNLLLSFLFLTLATYTKGVAGLLFTPALFIYALLNKQLVATLKNKYLYLGAVFFTFWVAGYYLLREHMDPGYIKTVEVNELGGRFTTVTEGCTGPWYFYMLLLVKERYLVWIWTLPASLIAFFFIKDSMAKKALFFCWLCATVYMAVISTSLTKQFWYDLPLFPLLAVIGAISIWQIAITVTEYFPQKYPDAVLIAMVVLLGAYPLRNVIIRTTKDDDSKWENGFNNPEFYHIGYFLRSHLHTHDLDNTYYLSAGYQPQTKLYLFAANDNGANIQHLYFDGQNPLKDGAKVITDQPDPQQYVETKYRYTVAITDKNVRVYKIIGAK